jgi:hypothetical protein
MNNLHNLTLSPWRNGKVKCAVLHIYVANAVDIVASDFQNLFSFDRSRAQLKYPWDIKKLRSNDFVYYMNKEISKAVFGETFGTLVGLMKGVS